MQVENSPSPKMSDTRHELVPRFEFSQWHSEQFTEAIPTRHGELCVHSFESHPPCGGHRVRVPRKVIELLAAEQRRVAELPSLPGRVLEHDGAFDRPGLNTARYPIIGLGAASASTHSRSRCSLEERRSPKPRVPPFFGVAPGAQI